MKPEHANDLLEDFDDHKGKIVIEIGGKNEGVVKYTFVRNNKLIYRLDDGREVKVALYRIKE